VSHFDHSDMLLCNDARNRMLRTSDDELCRRNIARIYHSVARHRLEKIKTIGDCYMIASGIPHALTRVWRLKPRDAARRTG
jgi:class 3 adenylate cyclase